MTEKYLQIMIESLEKKIKVLDKIMELNEKQSELVSYQPMDMKAFDETMEDKGKLIDEINKLNDGFSATYELVKDDVQANTEKYRDKVLIMQELIRTAVDKSVAVEVQEKRNKSALETVFRMKRTELKQMKKSTTAALKYYKSMSKVNYIDPQLMDKKK